MTKPIVIPANDRDDNAKGPKQIASTAVTVIAILMALSTAVSPYIGAPSTSVYECP